MIQNTSLIRPGNAINFDKRSIQNRPSVLLKKLAASLMLLWMILNSSDAATLLNGYTEAVVASGLSSPTAMEFAPDGRLFVSQQGGQLRVIKNGSLLATPFVTVTVDSVGERGLLGIAFDPNFAVNHYVYVYYTATSPAIHNRVSRFTANGDVAVAGSEMVILDLNNLSGASNHNGGGLHFGLDGKLYITAGENANSANSQTLANLLGKILRLNSDGTIPTDNPYYNTASGVNRAIWAMGLRNPFTFAVQPGTGRIIINDVGENTWEEINEAVAGANYGWPNCEGSCGNSNYRDPLFRYSHGSGTGSGFAIAGGAFYNPSTFQFPGTNSGVYFFADYVNGWIRRMDPAQGNQVSVFATGISSPVDLKVGDDGRLYYLARGSGAVYAISYIASQAPQITQQPVDQTVNAGQSATFTVAASGTATLAYQWKRNNANISGATFSSYTLASASAADDGVAFRCTVANLYGSVTSSPALLHISNNAAPTPTIISPTNGTLYSAGDTIQYRGSGSDLESGNLTGSAFSWTIMFCHDIHTHPFLGPINGATNGSFVIPTQGETAADVWYRIYLTVTDSAGATNTTFVDVVPRTVNVTLATIPPGLQVTLDGQPVTTSVSVTGVVGMQRVIGVVSPQTLNGTNYTFTSWSDGGAATHNINWPAAVTTYTATYQAVPAGAVLFADDFTRATNPGSLSPWVAALGTWSVTGGMLQGAATSQNYGQVYMNTNWTDYSVQARVRFTAGAFGGGIGGRVTVATGAHYAAWVYPETTPGGSGVLRLIKFRSWNTWSGTSMQQVSLASVGTNWHALKLTCEGSRIQVSYDGNAVMDVTDNGFDNRAAYLSGGIVAGIWQNATAFNMFVEDVVVNAIGALPVNQPPVANNDSYSIAAGTTLGVATPGVLVNDTDANGNSLKAVLTSTVAHGTLTLNTNGSFSYTPASGYSGADSFTYAASDGVADSAAATVSITVTPAPSGNLFSDSFTRSTISPWVAAMGNWTLTSGVLNGTSAAQSYANVYLNTNWTDYSVQARIQFPAGAFGGGLGGRVTSSSGTHYGAWVYPEGSTGGSSVLKLIKFRGWTSWSGTPMQQVALPGVGTGWHTLKLTFIANQIQVYYDSVLMITALDNGFDNTPAYLSGGISADLWTLTSAFNMSVDDVSVDGAVAQAAPGAVLPGSAKIESLIISQDGQVHLTLRASAGQSYVVQGSTDLESWDDLGAVQMPGELAEFVDVNATNYQSRYYRTKLVQP